MRKRPGRKVSVAFAATGCAVALAACGSSGKPSPSASGGHAAALKFSNCMRSHGQPDFPDPTLGAPGAATRVIVLREMFFPVGPGIDPLSPAFRRAADACGLRLR
jgi:hypothetical protein